MPGIFQVSGGNTEDDMEDSLELAQAILDTLYVEPEDADDKIPAVDSSGRKWWPYADWQDLCTRVEDASDTNVKLGEEASQYIEWQPSEQSVFKMKISCESMGMKREVTCKCYVNEKKVRYIEWRED